MKVKSKWNANTRTNIKGSRINNGIVEYLYSMDTSVGIQNYLDNGEYFPNDSNYSEPSDDPDYDVMFTRLPHITYLKNNGNRKTILDRNNPTKSVALDVPSFMNGNGVLVGNEWIWTQGDITIKIIITGSQVAFDAILGSDPGIDHLDFNLNKIGMTEQEVLDLFGSLILYEQNNPENSRPLIVTFPNPNKVRITWDDSGMVYPLVVDPTIEISNGGDDGYWRPHNNGFSRTTNTSYWGDLGGSTGTWWRFSNLNVPQGLPIDVATITFTHGVTKNVTALGTLRCADEDDAAEVTEESILAGFSWTSGTTYNLSRSVSAGDFETTINFKSEIEAVIGREGWVGNHLVVNLKDEGTVSDVFRPAMYEWIYDPATLHVEYWGVVEATIISSFDDGTDSHPPNSFASNTSLQFGDVSGQVKGAFVRFQLVDIPKNGTIETAVLKFIANTSESGTTCNARIQGYDVDSCPLVFDHTDYHTGFDSNLTTAFVDWDNIPAWTAETEYSIDISSVVQEIISRPGWTSSNHLGIYISDNGSSTNAVRTPYSYDNNPAKSTKLNVTWSGALDMEIAASEDDGHVRVTGVFNNSSTAVTIGNSSGLYNTFLRFPNIIVPGNGNIDIAELELVAGSTSSSNVIVNIRVEDTDDAAQITSEVDFGTRILTNGTPWTPPPFTSNVVYTTPNFAADIQTVIDRAGWVPNSHIQVIISDDGSNESSLRNFRSIDYVSGIAVPKLHLEWSIGITYNPIENIDAITTTNNSLLSRTWQKLTSILGISNTTQVILTFRPIRTGVYPVILLKLAESPDMKTISIASQRARIRMADSTPKLINIEMQKNSS